MVFGFHHPSKIFVKPKSKSQSPVPKGPEFRPQVQSAIWKIQKFNFLDWHSKCSCKDWCLWQNIKQKYYSEADGRVQQRGPGVRYSPDRGTGWRVGGRAVGRGRGEESQRAPGHRARGEWGPADPSNRQGIWENIRIGGKLNNSLKMLYSTKTCVNI